MPTTNTSQHLTINSTLNKEVANTTSVYAEPGSVEITYITEEDDKSLKLYGKVVCDSTLQNHQADEMARNKQRNMVKTDSK